MEHGKREHETYTIRGITDENRRWLRVESALSELSIGAVVNILIDRARDRAGSKAEHLAAGSDD